MKIKFFSLMIVAVAMVFGLTSCKDDSYEEATLNVTPAEVTFTTDGGAQRVVVTTNRSKWVATSPQNGDWITLATNGDQLTITAAANTGAARTGYILVNAGDAAATVTLSQAAGSGSSTSEFTVTPENAALDMKGGNARFDVVGTTDYTVTTSADWLTITKIEGASFFNVVAGQYKETGTREAKVNVQSGAVIKEITITQQGRLNLLLPYMAEDFVMADVLEFEEERGSRLIETPTWLTSKFVYMTTSNRIAQVTYTFPSATRLYTEAEAISLDPTLATSSDFKAFMEENGFTLENQNADQTEFSYTNSKYPYAATVTTASSGTTITLNYHPVQSQAYPTFETLPMADKLSWCSDVDASVHGKRYDPDVIAYESSQNSTKGEEAREPSTWYVTFETGLTGKLEPFMRAYWMETRDGDYYGEVTSLREAYKDFTVAFFESNGSYYMTREFTKLLTDNGYQFLRLSNNYRFYQKDRAYIAFSAGIWTNDDPTIVCDFQAWQVGASAGGDAFRIVTKEYKGVQYYEVEYNDDVERIIKSGHFHKVVNK